MQIILKLTTACNLNCVYCSEGDSEPQSLPPKIFFKLVDDLPALLESLNTKDADFLFHGGEPMLYGRDKLKLLIDYATSHLSNYNTRFLMQTNGVLIDEEWINFFKQENISVGISLDGYPELHDKNRRTKTGEPTAEKVLQNIKLMRDSDLNAGTLMVLNSAENIDVNKLFDFIRENELQPKIHPVIPCGRAKNRTDTSEVFDTWSDVMKGLLEKSLAEDSTEIIQPLDEILDAILGISPVLECSFNGSCGKSFICLYPDGETGFCGRDNFARLLTYGNIKEKSLIELYNSANAEKIRARQEYLKNNDCKNCTDFALCHGGCAFEAVNFFGTINAKYPNCEAQKKFIHWLRTEGLRLLKTAFIRQKAMYRKSLKSKKKLLEKIDNLKSKEVH